MDADERVERLILDILRHGGAGWKQAYPVPSEHLRTCSDVQLVEAEAHGEMWFDSGVEATRLTAVIRCPHEGPIEWEWADLGDLPALLADLEDEL